MQAPPELKARWSARAQPDSFLACGVHVRAAWGVADESRQVLDAFYLGRAVAQTASERLGAVLGDVLSEVVKISAEQQRAIKYSVAALIAHRRHSLPVQLITRPCGHVIYACLGGCRDFQDEVRARAEADRAGVLPTLSSPSTASRSTDPRFANARNVNVRPYTEQPAPDLQVRGAPWMCANLRGRCGAPISFCQR